MEEKRGKKNDGEGIDRLSNLPECLLLHILSFLPTRTCVNTMSLVSHTYRNLWEHLHVLNVKDEDFHNLNVLYDEDLFRYLSLFVNAFLARRKSRHIHKFRLSFNLFDLDKFSTLYVDTWIRTVIGPYLEELHLSLDSDEDVSFKFPLNSLSSCPKLVSLSLSGDIVLQQRSSWAVYLPLLKKLKIDDLNHFVEVPFLDKLLSCCPILEILEVSIRPKSLTTLCVPNSLRRLKFTCENGVGTCLEIDAPGLKYLSLKRIMLEDSTIVNLHNVEEAYFDVFSPSYESVSFDTLNNLLRALSRVKHLVLDSSTTKSLFDAKFSEFRHLIHLELILPCLNIGFFYHALRKCPMLQALIIKNRQDKLPPIYGWARKPKKVPNCLVSHLTFVHFIGYQGNCVEKKFIEYVLRKGLVLKTMHISNLSEEKCEKNSIITHFSNISRGSVSCELKFD